MKTTRIFWGIILIAAAVLIIIDTLGLLPPISSVVGEISLFRVGLALLVLYFIVSRFVKGKIAQIFIPLALLFMLFEKNIAFLLNWESENIISNYILLLCAVIIQIGFHLIFGNFKFGMKKNRHFGDSVMYIDSSDLSFCKSIENNFGTYNIYFENVNQYSGDGILRVENNLGTINIYVPACWKIEMDIENNLGSTKQTGVAAVDGLRLRIIGENNLGSIHVNVVQG